MDDEKTEQAAAAEEAKPAGGGRRAVVAGGAAAGVVVAAGVAYLVDRAVAGSSSGGLQLTVNGRTYPIRSAPTTPLLYVLRDELGLRGPKFGCGLAECGACAVLVGMKETRSCVLPVAAVKGEVTTLEGLPGLWAKQQGHFMAVDAASAEALHPVQQAWIDEQVPQCGYCQNGMMIMAVDLLSRIHHPTEAQIRDAFTNTPPSAHLCRCGTYDSIIRAVQRAAQLMS
jgi:aerobic-type carbon monoxide dehydrogenase small subunit (CoxS/CutS family)